MLKRLGRLPAGRSVLLLGPRQTDKSTLLPFRLFFERLPRLLQ